MTVMAADGVGKGSDGAPTLPDAAAGAPGQPGGNEVEADPLLRGGGPGGREHPVGLDPGRRRRFVARGWRRTRATMMLGAGAAARRAGAWCRRRPNPR